MTNSRDLKRRLRATRWPERECVDDWTQGLPLGYAQEVASYWLEKHDWRRCEARLNRFRSSRPRSTASGSILSMSARRIPTRRR